MATTEERFVATKVIRDAVRGREGEVLDALGINWRARGHSRCPYPDHDDEHPSWRWDVKKRLAFCSCRQKAANIFDVVRRMRGLADFETAKLEVAELLGRDDLIVTKSGNRQFHDADSLMNAPANRRDDS